MIERIRQYFILDDSQLKLYLLAVVTGLLAGGVIVLFRLTITTTQLHLIPSGEIEGFSSLPWTWILGLPVLSGLLIGLIFGRLSSEERSIGVVHIIERLSYHEGRLPWRNAVLQFFGSALALISGHSVGREGPSVHLGAASGSILGANLDLPNNSVRVLVAAGSAAAIAASFNTPIAGVIFAMEVIMMEYHIATFIPIILASVSGTVINRLVFGEEHFFGQLAAEMHSLWEIPYIIFLGILLGFIATFFIHCLKYFSNFLAEHSLWKRTTLAGVLVGLGGLIMPDVMGMSSHITNSSILAEMTVASLLLLLFLKLILSSACIGLGIPGGLIGPTMIIGAIAGAILGIIGNYFFPDLSSSTGFYAMIGMCAMMGATIKAPLAALMALLELTANPHIIMPGMLAIVFSSIIVSDLFKQDFIFLSLLRARGLDYRNDPISQTLRRISVSKAMQRNFVILPEEISREGAKHALSSSPLWIIVQQDTTPTSLLPASDLARAVAEQKIDVINLFKIPASRQNLVKASLHDSLQEAQDILNKNNAEALYISRVTAPMIERTYGILTRQAIESYYQVPKN